MDCLVKQAKSLRPNQHGGGAGLCFLLLAKHSSRFKLVCPRNGVPGPGREFSRPVGLAFCTLPPATPPRLSWPEARAEA